MVNSHVSTGSIGQTIVASFEAPRLEGMYTKRFIYSKKYRDLHKIQNENKNRDTRHKIQLVFYKASVDDADLKKFRAAGFIEASSNAIVTKEQII